MHQATCDCGGKGCERFFVYQTGKAGVTIVCPACGRSYAGWTASGVGRSIGARAEGVSAGVHAEVASKEKVGGNGQSYESMKPWESAGVSKATWYRHRKASDGGV